MGVTWNTPAINAYVKPPIGRAILALGPGNGVKGFINNLGDFPSGFSGKAELEIIIDLVEKTYKAVTEVPGYIDGIGRGMSYGDEKSLYDFIKYLYAKQADFRDCKAASVWYDTTGEKATSDDIENMRSYNLDNYSTETQHADMTAMVNNIITGSNPVYDFLTGLLGGGAAYTDGLVNGACSVVNFGAGYVYGIGEGKDDPMVEAVKAAAVGGDVSNLEGLLDDGLSKTSLVNTDSWISNASKFVGNILTQMGIAVAIPGGVATKAFTITTAATTTFGLSVKNDADAIGGYDKIDSTDARAIAKHAGTNATISAATALLASGINTHALTSPPTLQEYGAKTVEEAIKKRSI